MTIPHLKAHSTRFRLLHFLANSEDGSYYVRELAAIVRMDPTNLSRELRRLTIDGVLIEEVRGNQKHFRINPHYEFYTELSSLIRKIGFQLVSDKHVYVIAGPNGAGKTTFAKTFLPKYMRCNSFINADLIAGGLAPFRPEEVSVKAGKLLLKEINLALQEGKNFGFETTLSGKSYLHLLKRLKERGFAIHLFFLWIPNLQMSIQRIQDRVRRGGHHIPDEIAGRRFYRGISNLFNLYEPLLSSWTLIDNSGPEPDPIASKDAKGLSVYNQTTYDRILGEVKKHAK